MRKQIIKKASILVSVIGFFLIPMNLKAQVEAQKDKKFMFLKLPDLTVKIKCIPTVYPGQKLGKGIEVVVKNKGTAAAKDFFVDLVLSSDTTIPVKFATYSPSFSEDALLKGGREHVKSICPGASVNLTLYGINKIPGNTLPGIYYLGVIVDPANKVKESNEGNNAGLFKIEIVSIEELPRIERLEAYVEALREKSLPANDRLRLISAFAKHAIDVSPLYGKSTVLIDEKIWIALLTEGWRADRYHKEIVIALTQIHLNRKEYKQALKIITPYHEKYPPGRKDNYWRYKAAAFKQWAYQKTRKLLRVGHVFDIHFCVITKSLKGPRTAILKQLHEEVNILDKYFRTIERKRIVGFRFKSASMYDDVKNLGCRLVDLGDLKGKDFPSHMAIFDNCKHKKVRDPHAINFYIYDRYNSIDSFGISIRHAQGPYVFIDLERLGHRVQSPEEHEMGHAFGLRHVGVPGATSGDSTNIMSSVGCEFGSGGKRNLGFTEAQQAIIYYYATRTMDRLKK